MILIVLNKAFMSYAEDRYIIPQTRGGRRPGSGRKKLGHVPLMLHISTEADQELRLAAKRCESTPSRVVEQLIAGIKNRS
jgi:hypothetical protein